MGKIAWCEGLDGRMLQVEIENTNSAGWVLVTGPAEYYVRPRELAEALLAFDRIIQSQKEQKQHG